VSGERCLDWGGKGKEAGQIAGKKRPKKKTPPPPLSLGLISGTNIQSGKDKLVPRGGGRGPWSKKGARELGGGVSIPGREGVPIAVTKRVKKKVEIPKRERAATPS